MIQRKQSLFLFLAVCAMATCFMFPIATFEALSSQRVPGTGDPIPVSGELNLLAKPVPEMMSQILNNQPVTLSQSNYVNVWPLLVLTLLVAAIALVSIFLYKNRVRQMKVVALGFLLGVVQLFLIFIWAVDAFVNPAVASMNCTDVAVHYGIGTWTSVAAIVLLFLAQRSIKKDEEKVRAADRLR